MSLNVSICSDLRPTMSIWRLIEKESFITTQKSDKFGVRFQLLSIMKIEQTAITSTVGKWWISDKLSRTAIHSYHESYAIHEDMNYQ